MIGKRFHRLVVLAEEGREKWGDITYLCQCDCGVKLVVHGKNLRRNNSQSCGCLKVEHLVQRSKTHGMSGTRFYKIFKRIKKRCSNPKETGFKNYGGRGIRCLWLSPEQYRDDMLESYIEHVKVFGERQTTIDRRDNNGHYCKENCRWATYKQQARNTRRNTLYEFKGEKHCLSEWIERYGLPSKAIENRVQKLHWPLEKALTTPIRKW